MRRMILVGGGGFAKEAAEIAELGGYEVVAYVAREEGLLDRPYWGALEQLQARRDAFDCVALAVGATDRKSIARRRELVAWLQANDLAAPPLVSPHAVIARGAAIGDGTIVAHATVVSVDAQVGPYSILNTGAIIGHDAAIGSNVTVAPGAFIGGAAAIGDDSLVGPGATVLQSIEVGQGVVIGVGASVVRNVPPGATVFPLRSKTVQA